MWGVRLFFSLLFSKGSGRVVRIVGFLEELCPLSALKASFFLEEHDGVQYLTSKKQILLRSSLSPLLSWKAKDKEEKYSHKSNKFVGTY